MKEFPYQSVPVDHDPFAGPEIVQVIQTTEPQKEIWLSCMMGGEDANRSYNESVTVHLNGSFNRYSMNTAFRQLLTRHESLRSTFSPDGLTMIIYRELPVNIYFEDLTLLGEQEQKDVLESYGQKDAGTTFDLQQGPLIRPSLFKINDETHLLRITAHHIVCDGWSMGVILNELGKLYTAYNRNEIPVISPAPSFGSFAHDQLTYAGTPEQLLTEKYWLDQFRVPPTILKLPTDFERPAIRGFKSRRDDYQIDKSLVAAIKKMGAKAGCSFVTTMLAAFEVLLYHSTGQGEVILGLPAAGQSAAGTDALIGHCVNLLPLRSFPKDEQSFGDFLKTRKKAIFDAYDHQQFTFGTLLKKLAIPRDPSRVPLVPVVFNIDMAMNNGVAFAGLKHKLVSNPRLFETFEIFLNATGAEDSLILEWSYNTSLFSGETIARMMRNYKKLLTDVSRDPLTRIGELGENFEQKTGLQYSGNDTDRNYPSNSTLPDLIADQAALTPQYSAVSHNGTSYTHQQIDSLSSQFAAQLVTAGVKNGDVVGLAIERSPYIVISMLAILKAGAAYVPVDPEFPADRISYMLADSSAALLLTSKKYKSTFATKITELTVEELHENSARFPSDFVAGNILPSALAYILYTSGSTGKPKGARITHRNLVNLLCSMQEILNFTSKDTILGLTTISFDISGVEIFLPLITGAHTEIVSSEIARDGFALMNLIRQQKPSVVQATPATWQMLVEAGWDTATIIPTICTAGEPLSRELAEKLLPRSQSLFNIYGPTETTIYSTFKKVTSVSGPITIGKPVANTRVYILDPNGQLVSENEQGEIYIAGDGVAEGYHNQEALTKEKFLPDRFSGIPGSVMYKTGDLGKYLPDGDILCLGRIDQQVKIRGYRIEPGEIEYCLSKQPAVKQAVVMAREDKPGDQRLVAYIVLQKPVSQDINQLMNAWKQSVLNFMPAYMCPQDFVIVEKMPVTPGGKVDRLRLPKPLVKTGLSLPADVTMSPAEIMLTDIWSKILSVEKPGLHDDFFQLGGHSLIAMKMMSAVEKETGKQFPLSVLFECPTIAQLAARLEKKQPEKPFKSLVPMKHGNGKMPLYIVHGARGTVPIFNRTIEHLHPDQPIFGLQASGVDGKGPIIDNVEELASNYIKEIIESNPRGPYALAGYSFGGFVAFEMARQLKLMNREVKALIIFDTAADAGNNLLGPVMSRLNGLRLLTLSKLYGAAAFVKNPFQKIRYEREELKMRMHKPYRRVKTWIEGKEKDLFYYKYKIEETNLKAKANYKLKEFDGVVELFRANTRTYYLDDYKYLGWKPYAKKGVRIHEIPGEHNKIFLPPNVNELARKLQLCLDNSVRGETIEIPVFYKKRMMEAV